MRQISPTELRALALDIEAELDRLRQLERDIQRVQAELVADPGRGWLYHENLALKLHNFYTGCEHIFHIVASELNHSVPSGSDWHRRLLERMGMDREERPALLSAETVHHLREYLAFRHVVRNIYGYEIDPERSRLLLERYPPVWREVEADVKRFITWLNALADQMKQPPKME